MKYAGHPLFVLLVAGMFLSACSPKTGSQSGALTATATAGLAKIETYPEPTLSVPAVFPVTPVSSSDEIEETEPAVLEIPYTEANPLTDVEAIQDILDRLQERELAWFSRPGWLQFTTYHADSQDTSSIQHVWTHIIDESLRCREQFVYFEYEGEILPFTIRLEDGSSGFIIPVTEGRFQRADMIRETSPACTLKSSWIMTFQEEEDDYDFILHDEAREFRSYLNRDVPGIEYRFLAWVEEMDGKKTFILVYDITIRDPTLRGTILEPATGYQTPYTRNVRIHYIDLETGLQVRWREEFYQENGQRLNTRGDIGILYRYEYHEALPEPIAQAYDQTAQALRDYVERSGSQ